MSTPQHCRPRAYELFAQQLSEIETDSGLLRAATAIAMHQLDGVTFEGVDAAIDALADKVRARVRSDLPQAILAHAHDVLFEEERFHGDADDHYNPQNSYIPSVLERRRGLPIALCLVYKLVLGRLGLRVEGVGAPAHFLAAVHAEPGRLPMLIDPYHGGRALSRPEAMAMIERALGRRIEPTDAALPIVTHARWVLRILLNLHQQFARSQDPANLAAMTELAELLARSGEQA